MPLLKRGPEVSPSDLFELPRAGFPWRVAHTRSRQEKSLARYLEPLGVPFYLPHREQRIRRSGRTFVSFLPLFPGYLFFRGGETQRLAVLRSNVVVRILEVQDQILLDSELAQLRALQESGASLVPYPSLRLGDPVRIVEGPFRGYRGVVLREKGGERLVVSISMLRKSVAVELDRAGLASDLQFSRRTGSGRSAAA